MKFRRCDNCGTINPKRLYGEDRLCGEPSCVKSDGFYKLEGWDLGTNGKVGSWEIQFPVRLKWIGFWTL
jgi:hypothetical protein